MSSRSKRTSKTRSSIVYCEEKFGCDSDKAEATHECVECGTKQCGNCDSNLHSGKLDWHDRNPIATPSSIELCQSSCEKRNYADVTCDDCNLNLCNTCNDRLHVKSKKKGHKRRPYSLPAISELKLDENPILPEHENSEHRNDGNVTQDNHSSEFAECISEYFSLGSQETKHVSNETGKMSSKIDFSLGEEPKLKPSVVVESVQETTFQKGRQERLTSTKSQKKRQTNIDIDDEIYRQVKAFLLADQDENVKIKDEVEFLSLLHCDGSQTVKVISIFGNTGDGKSHTLNHAFFGGREVFKTSAAPRSCTAGVWAAFDPVHNAVIFDTEGLLGVSPNQNQRTRLLLKILAVSDIVIYRTKADRLHTDLFTFLGDASKAYTKHFTEELKAAALRANLNLPLSSLGPSVIIFHETQHTQVLGKDTRKCADELIKDQFTELEQDMSAFSSIQYVGTQTKQPPTDFNGLLLAAKTLLRNNSVRSPRKPTIVYRTLKVLNEKFSGDIEKSLPSSFPDQYFTCTSECLACRHRCEETVNHEKDLICHHSSQKCKYKDQYENKIYLCKACYNNGKEEVVVPKASSARDNTWVALAKYAWAGYALECRTCGIIYRSRQYWYGNEDPVRSVVRTEVRHIWAGSNQNLAGTHNAARRLLDGIHYMSDTISSVSAKPAKAMTMWITDQIAPPYWVPNAKITNCHHCNQLFDSSQQIHHCRACGNGFCDLCSEKKRPVPERGWGLEPVRVCDNCYHHSSSGMSDSGSSDHDSNTLMPRKLGEAIGSTVGAVASVVNYPLDALQDSARPPYWVPNHKIKKCCVCAELFGPKLRIHHCRCCGQGVCDVCSATRRPVPSRGWDHKVRICDTCNTKSGQL